MPLRPFRQPQDPDTLSTAMEPVLKARQQQQAAEQQATAEENSRRMAEYAPESRPTYIDPVTKLVTPKQDDATWQASQQEKHDTEEAKALAKIERQEQIERNAANEAKWRADNRPMFVNDKHDIVPIHDDATWEAVKKSKSASATLKALKTAEKSRKDALRPELQTLALDIHRNPARQPLGVTQRKDIDGKIQSTIEAAKNALTAHYGQQAKAVDVGSTWNPFDNQPAAGTDQAQAKLDQIAQTYTDPTKGLSDEHLADLQTIAPDLATQLHGYKIALADDDAKVQWQKDAKQRLYDLSLKEQNPTAYLQHKLEQLQGLDDAQATKHLEALRTDLLSEREQLDTQHQTIEQTLAGFDQAHTALAAANDQARQHGIPAGQTVTLPDGTVWHATLYAQAQRAALEQQKWQADTAPDIEALTHRQQDWQQRAQLLDAAEKSRHQQQVQQRQDHIEKIRQEDPETAGLIDEHDQRAADIAKRYAPDSPEFAAAEKALTDDLTQRQTALTQKRQSKAEAGEKLYASLKDISSQWDWTNPPEADKELTGKLIREQGRKLGLSPKETTDALALHKAADWTVPHDATWLEKSGLGIPNPMALLPFLRGDTEHAKKTAVLTPTLDDLTLHFFRKEDVAPEQFRVLPNGVLSINPVLTFQPSAYQKAVESSNATPEARQAALERRDAMAQESAKASLPILSTTPEFAQFQKRADIKALTPEAQAARFLEEVQEKPKAWSSKLWDQMRLATGNALLGIAQTVTGAITLATGNNTARAITLDLDQRRQDRAARTAVTGSSSDRYLRTAGSLVDNALQMLPTLGVGALAGKLVSYGSKLATAARASTGLADFAETLGHLTRLESKGVSFASPQAMSAAIKSGSGIGEGLQAATQMYPAAFNAYKKQYLADGMDEDKSTEAAHRSAMLPSLLSLATTAVIGYVGGNSGAEALLNKATMAEAKKGFLNFVTHHLPREMKKEAVEEFWQTTADELTAQATYDPDRKVGDMVGSVIEGAFQGALLGGGFTTVGAIAAQFGKASPRTQPGAAESRLEPHQLPETIAAAKAAIASFAPEGYTPEQHAEMQQRAQLVLGIAHGEMPKTEQDWNKLGYTLKDGKPEPLKDYTGPKVLDFADKEHQQPVILQSYIDSMDKALPAVADAIGMDEADVREFYQTSPSNVAENVQTATTTAPSPTKAATDSTAPNVAANVQNDDQIDLSPGPLKPAPANDEKDDASIANESDASLQARTTPGPQREAAHKARREAAVRLAATLRPGDRLVSESGDDDMVVDGTPTKGGSHVSIHGYDEPIDVASELTASTARDAHGNPIHIPARTIVRAKPSPKTASPTEPATAARGSVAQAATAATPPSAVDNAENGAEARSASAPFAHLSGDRAVKRATELSNYLHRDLRLADEGMAQRIAAALVRRHGTEDHTYMGHVASKHWKQDLKALGLTGSLKPTKALEGEGLQAPEDFEARLKSYEMRTDTELEALGLGSGFRAMLNPTAEQQALEARKRKVAAMRASQSEASQPSASPPVATVSPSPASKSPSLPTTPTLASIPGYTEQAADLLSKATLTGRKRLRTTLKALESTLQTFGKAFSKIQLVTNASPATKSNLPSGNMMRVEADDSLTINLPALASQLDYLARSTRSVEAIASEEFIHRVAMSLAAQDSRFSFKGLVAFWNRLPAKLQQTVWQAYHNNALKDNPLGPLSKPSALTDEGKFHMAHEFIRMLVQDKAFAGRITETVDNPGLLQWIRDLLSTVAKRLRSFLGKAPKDVQAQAAHYEAQVIAALDRFRGAYTAATSTPASNQQHTAEAIKALQTIAPAAPATNPPASVGIPPPEVSMDTSPAAASAAAILDAHNKAAQTNSGLPGYELLTQHLAIQASIAQAQHRRSEAELRAALSAGRITTDDYWDIQELLRIAQGAYELGGPTGPDGELIAPPFRLGIGQRQSLQRLGIDVLSTRLGQTGDGRFIHNPYTLATTSGATPRVYVERRHLIISQGTIDHLAKRLPHTAQLIGLSEAQARAQFGLPAKPAPQYRADIEQQAIADAAPPVDPTEPKPEDTTPNVRPAGKVSAGTGKPEDIAIHISDLVSKQSAANMKKAGADHDKRDELTLLTDQVRRQQGLETKQQAWDYIEAWAQPLQDVLIQQQQRQRTDNDKLESDKRTNLDDEGLLARYWKANGMGEVDALTHSVRYMDLRRQLTLARTQDYIKNNPTSVKPAPKPPTERVAQKLAKLAAQFKRRWQKQRAADAKTEERIAREADRELDRLPSFFSVLRSLPGPDGSMDRDNLLLTLVRSTIDIPPKQQRKGRGEWDWTEHSPLFEGQNENLKHRIKKDASTIGDSKSLNWWRQALFRVRDVTNDGGDLSERLGELHDLGMFPGIPREDLTGTDGGSYLDAALQSALEQYQRRINGDPVTRDEIEEERNREDEDRRVSFEEAITTGGSESLRAGLLNEGDVVLFTNPEGEEQDFQVLSVDEGPIEAQDFDAESNPDTQWLKDGQPYGIRAVLVQADHDIYGQQWIDASLLLQIQKRYTAAEAAQLRAEQEAATAQDDEPSDPVTAEDLAEVESDLTEQQKPQGRADTPPRTVKEREAKPAPVSTAPAALPTQPTVRTGRLTEGNVSDNRTTSAPVTQSSKPDPDAPITALAPLQTYLDPKPEPAPQQTAGVEAWNALPKLSKARYGLPSGVAIDSLTPFSLSGNKAALLEDYLLPILRTLAKRSKRFIDAFGGAGTYTHVLAEAGDLPPDSILNEYEWHRALTHKWTKINPHAVAQNMQTMRDQLHAARATQVHQDDKRREHVILVNQWLNEQLHPDLAVQKTEWEQYRRVALKDEPRTAALYLVTQGLAFGNRTIETAFFDGGLPGLTVDGASPMGHAFWTEGVDGDGKPKKASKGFLAGYITPTGLKVPDRILNAPRHLQEASQRLKNVTILGPWTDTHGDALQVIAQHAQAGDLISYDPPYLPNIITGGVGNYGLGSGPFGGIPFSLDKLKTIVQPASDKGALVVSTNNFQPALSSGLSAKGWENIGAYRAGTTSLEDSELISFSHPVLATGDSTASAAPQPRAGGHDWTATAGRPAEQGPARDHANPAQPMAAGSASSTPAALEGQLQQAPAAGRAPLQPQGPLPLSPADGQSSALAASPRGPTTSPEFKSWFAGSQIVNLDGTPLLMHHGTPVHDFDTFEHGVRRGSYAATSGAFYFTSSRIYASNFRDAPWATKPAIIPAYLKATSPLAVKHYGDMAYLTPAKVQAFKDQGYDALIWHDSKNGMPFFEVAVFTPEQVWIATDNNQSLASSPRSPSPISYLPSPAPAFYSRLQEAIRSAPFGQTEPKHPQQWGGVIQKWAGGRTAAASALWRAGIAKEELKWSGILPWLAAQNKPLTKAQVLDYLTTEGAVQFTEHRTGDLSDKFTVRMNTRPPFYVMEGTHGWDVHSGRNNDLIITLPTEDEADETVRHMTEGYHRYGNQHRRALETWEVISPRQELVSVHGTEQEAIESAEGNQRGYDDHGGGMQSTTRYAQYQLPGGTNYREVVLAMPVKSQNDPIQSFKRLADGSYDVIFRDGEEGSYDTLEEARADGNGTAEVKGVDEYRSSHFPNVPNYLAHMRLNDRVDAQGHPGTLLEELQSDRHQAARKKGYKREVEEWLAFYTTPNGADVPVGYGSDAASALANADPSWKGLVDIKTRKTGTLTEGQIPDAPHRKDWPLALFKRALRDAVAAGKQWIGWTTGQTQADRYDLSKQVDSVRVRKTGPNHYHIGYSKDGHVHSISDTDLTAEQLPDHIGKDLAQRIISDTFEGDKVKIYKDADLKIGGEGMKGFYDHMLPKQIGNYVKQWGATVEQTSIDASTTASVPSLQPITAPDWEAYQGAEPFPNGDRPLIGQTRISIDGQPANATVIVSSNGLHMIDYEGENEWIAPPQAFPNGLADKWFGTAQEALNSVEISWKNPQSKFWRTLETIIGEGKAAPTHDTTPIWKVTITPQMRASIQATGQPLFASTRDPSSQPPPLAGLLNLRYTDAHGNPITDANALREAHRASDPLQQGGSLRPDAQPRTPTTPAALLPWAKETGWLLNPAALEQRLNEDREIKGGDEHDVWFDEPSQRVLKITLDNQFIAGGPSGYLRNLRQQNQLFDAGYTFEGVVYDNGMHRIVTSQTYVHGSPAPTPAIDAYFDAKGFAKIHDGLYYSSAQDLVVSDARPANVLQEQTTGRIQPIDVQIRTPNASAIQRYEDILNARARGSLAASNRLSIDEKRRITASIYAHNEAKGSGTRISNEYLGGNAWFTPDNRYFHAEQHWFMLPDDADYTQAMQSGFVRLSFESGTDKTLWAEFYPPLSTKKIERLRTEALMKGAELQLDPDRTQTLAASTRSLDALAHQAATSPLNSLPQPTAAQKKAGNYQHGHLRVGPLDITIENPAGSLREGKDPSGKPWATPMLYHYGYVKGSTGKDGDHIDLFLAPGTPPDYNGPVWVINQHHAGQFDEHKALIAASVQNPAQALAAYNAHYTPDWQGAASIGLFHSVSSFHRWATEATHRRAPAAGDLPATIQVTNRLQTAAKTDAAKAALKVSMATTSPRPATTHLLPDEQRVRSLTKPQLLSELALSGTWAKESKDALVGLALRKQGLPFSALTEDEFLASHYFHQTNTDAHRPSLTADQLTHMTGGWVLPGKRRSAMPTAMDGRYGNTVGAQVVAVPLTGLENLNNDRPVRIRAGHSVAPDEVTVLTESSVYPAPNGNYTLADYYHAFTRAEPSPSGTLPSSPRRAYESLTFDPPYQTKFGDIVSYHWMSRAAGGSLVSDWNQAVTNAHTGRPIVHHFKVRKPDGLHTVSLETALGQLSPAQRTHLQAQIKSEQQRRADQANGQLTLFASQRTTAYDRVPGKGDPESLATGYLTGKHSSTIAATAAKRGDIGLLVTPLIPSYLNHADRYPFIAIDNGVFSKATPFSPTGFRSLVSSVSENPELRAKVLFVVAPDVVGDAKATLAQFPEWSQWIRNKRLPVALAAQDGLEHMLDHIPWDRINTLFIGGSTEWKTGDVEDKQAWADLFMEAHRRGIPVHMGRVNTNERIAGVAQLVGASTVDGTYLAYGPDKNLPILERMLDQLNVHGLDLGGQRFPELGRAPSIQELYDLALDPSIVSPDQLGAYEPATKQINAIRTQQGLPSLTGHRDQLELALFASPRPPSPVSESSPLARLGWNHLDRALTDKVADLTANPRASIASTITTWTHSSNLGDLIARAARFVQKELVPNSILPREVTAAMREMNTRSNMAGQEALDLHRALQGKPKFSDIAYPAEFAENPVYRERLFEAMDEHTAGHHAAYAWAKANKPMWDLGLRLRRQLIELGREGVKAGRLNLDTFHGLNPYGEDDIRGYVPRFTKDEVDEQTGSFVKKFRLGVRDLLQQRSTAWHITDTTRTDPRTGEFVTVAHDPNGRQWRFKSAQARDAFYEQFIRQQAAQILKEQGKEVTTMMTALDGQQRKEVRAEIKAMSLDQIDRPAELSTALAGLAKRAIALQRQRFAKENPYEPAALVKDAVYSIARYTAQMAHDNATAQFLNTVAGNPAWTTDAQTTGFTQIPDHPRFGRLAGKFVLTDIATQITELVNQPTDALRVYDTFMGWWKSGKTVLNPGTHVRNVLGNLYFSHLAGSSVWNPGNLTYYQQAIKALAHGGQTLTDAYKAGVLGADFVGTELRQTLRSLVPTEAVKPDDILSIGTRLAQLLPHWAKRPLQTGYDKVATLYQVEDEVFKLAAWLKAQAMGMDPAAAAEHVRKWFPFFDGATSSTLRGLGRTVMPFLGFYRESARIFSNALRERPIALAAGLALPSLLTAISASLFLGLDDDELTQVQRDMRGKGGKLLGPTPLAARPLFSILLPTKTSNGDLQQFDLSSIHPFADFLGTRVESNDAHDWWQDTWRSLIAAGPLGNLAYSQATGRDAFGDRSFVESNMEPSEKARARLDNAAKIILPPLAPGGTGYQTLANAGTRSTDKSYTFRTPAQAVERAVLGLDVRNAQPDIYRIADDWRQAHGLPVQAALDYRGTTPAGRVRKAIFTELAQPTPDLQRLKTGLQRLADLGHPIRNQKDIDALLSHKNPLSIIDGKERQQQFRASLTGQDRATLERAIQAYQQIKAKAPALLAQARVE